MHTVLVVDDSPSARRLIEDRLATNGLDVCPASDGHEALELIAERHFDLIVTDQRMPGIDGLSLVERVRTFSAVPIVVLTAYPTVEKCERALLLGASRYLDLRNLDQLPVVATELIDGTSEPAVIEVAPVTVSSSRKARDEELRSTLERLLRRTRGNISQVAVFLNKDRTTVLYHLRRLGLY